MDVVDSLSTASGADTVPSLDFDLITTVESENLWCEQCKVFKKVGVYLMKIVDVVFIVECLSL